MHSFTCLIVEFGGRRKETSLGKPGAGDIILIRSRSETSERPTAVGSEGKSKLSSEEEDGELMTCRVVSGKKRRYK